VYIYANLVDMKAQWFSLQPLSCATITHRLHFSHQQNTITQNHKILSMTIHTHTQNKTVDVYC